MRTRIARIIGWSIPKQLLYEKSKSAREIWRRIDDLPEKVWKRVCYKTADIIIDNIAYSNIKKTRKDIHKWMAGLR